jgi:K+-sensing histidine kinase KdpD
VQDHSDIAKFQDKYTLEKIRQCILKTFSHELLTPLNGIFGNFIIAKSILSRLPVIFGNELDLEQIMDSITEAECCCHVLKNIIRDFVDYSTMQSQELVLNST